MNIDYSIMPGEKLEKIEYNNKDVLISIIMPFYNNKKYIRQTVNSVLNQTFPCFELLIIDDGSDDKEALEELENIKKLDHRIKVIRKENEGASVARDYGARRSNKNAKYLMFLDDDDLIEKTYLECGYWTLETNKDASWAYTDSIGFDGMEYTWNKWFDSEKMKKENDLVNTCIIRKEDFFAVNGYELKEKAVYEDWNLWLKLLAIEKFPVRMSYYGMWYRRKKEGSELSRSSENKKRALKIIRETRDSVKRIVEAIQYPKYDYNWDEIVENVPTIPKLKNITNYESAKNKINILMIIPWMTTGGADRFNLELIKGLDKSKFDITVISTEPAINTYRQIFEKYCTVYDLSTFLDQKYWFAFIDYIIEKNNIDIVFNTNSEIGYAFLPLIKAKHSKIPIIDYVHMEEWYNRNGGYSRDSNGMADVIDKTLTCNENSRKIFIDYFKRKPSEVQTVYIGVDEKEFNPEKYDKKELLKKYDIPENKYVVSYICRITEQKRPFLLLQIIKKLKEKRKDFVFLIVGDGNLLNEMTAKSKKMGLADTVIFLGNKKNTEEIYKISDITINCSIKEGLALTSYESLAMGVPVISSDVGGQKELINKDVGIIIPCEQEEDEILNFDYSQKEINKFVDAINKVIKNLDKYKANSRKRILDKFTIDEMIKNMTKIFNEVKENPNKEKIENGKALEKQKNLCKELITKTFLEMEIKYTWQCKEYYKTMGYKTTSYKMELFKDKMWRFAPYRALIKFLKKIGIMPLIKKIIYS